MNCSKQITVTALILFIIGSLSGNAIGQRLGGDDEKTETLVLGTLAFVGLVVYDIATAPSSAKHYNEGLRDMFPLIGDRRFVGSGAYSLGQLGFSRATLVKDNSQPIFLRTPKVQQKRKISDNRPPLVLRSNRDSLCSWRRSRSIAQLGFHNILGSYHFCACIWTQRRPLLFGKSRQRRINLCFTDRFRCFSLLCR